KLEDVEPYLLDVRGHRETPREIVEEVRERYHRIGGRSPILEQTWAQAAALEAALNRGGEGRRGATGGEGDEEPRFRAFVGMRHWHPLIAGTLADMAAAGIRRAVGLAMAPHYSRLSIGAYFRKVEEAGAGIAVAAIERWGLLPGYLDALAQHVRAALERFPAQARDEVGVIFTAHSLPQRILDWGDPYPQELRATVEAVMQRLGPRPHEFAFQSAAMTPDPWLGPDAGEVIERWAAEGRRHILIAPIGFVTEHVEILYDVDIVFREQAAALGVHLERIDMLGTAPRMIEGLAALVRERAQEAGWL
ncbi:MAG: ferrochelatase, partial [Gemmatimonadetes bacterium]|nr:ferrochelatase [Gemmatimonadota bacterium]